jgi:excisionase family DNA binding protein
MQTAQPEPITAHFIRPQEWEELTGLSKWSAYRALRAGELRGVKLGGQWFVDKSELTDYFKRARRAA